MASPIVVADGLVKEFRVPEREAGLGAAIRALVHRRYRTARAVDGITFSIERGERVGFLGRNGAGKTTTLKMLAGLLHPTSGRIEVAGHEPRRRAPDFLSKITLVLGQKQQLLWDLPPVDTFELNRAIYNLSDDHYREVTTELIELLELGELVRRPTRQLSLGERMKCELVAALLHRPELLFLDEPTIGLDVAMQAALRGFIAAYNERHGATVLLTSHYMADVVALCPRVILIDAGRLSYDGPLPALVKKVHPGKRVTLRRPGRAPETHDLQVSEQALGEAIAKLLAEGPIEDLTIEDPPLEEVMRDYFAQPASEKPPA